MRRVVAMAALLLAAVPARAQDTREQALEQLRQEKARQLEPYKPGRVERLLLHAKRGRLAERLINGNGFYPRFGGLSTGSGFAAGVGFRVHLFETQGLFKTSAAFTAKGYRLAEAQIDFPSVYQDRLLFGLHVRAQHNPQEDYFGIGSDSLEENRSNYLYEGLGYMGTAGFRPISWMSTGIQLGVLNVNIDPGTDTQMPSIEQIFDDTTAPGLVDQPDFRHMSFFVDVDSRDEPKNARSGVHYRVDFANLKDQDFDRYTFNRFTAQALHFVPVFDKKRVFVLRGMVMMTNNAPGNAIPFYMLPTIGGAYTVRSLNEFRYRDENALVLNAEYRWEVLSGLDMALFVDAGKVTNDYRHLDLQDLESAVGIGFRLSTSKAVFFRVDIATGAQEGTQVFFKFGPVF